MSKPDAIPPSTGFLLRSTRYRLKANVEVSNETMRLGVGQLINISRDGAAITSYTPLPIGSSITVNVSGVGHLSGQIVRGFGTHSYGIKFNIDPSVKARLEQTISSIGTVLSDEE